MEITDRTVNKVELLADGIIFVERSGYQTEGSLMAVFEQGSKLAARLREQGRPVLVLNHAHGLEVSERVIALLQHFDFDRLAVYGTSQRLNNIRDLMSRANGLEDKIVSFRTEKDALAWLRSFDS